MKNDNVKRKQQQRAEKAQNTKKRNSEKAAAEKARLKAKKAAYEAMMLEANKADIKITSINDQGVANYTAKLASIGKTTGKVAACVLISLTMATTILPMNVAAQTTTAVHTEQRHPITNRTVQHYIDQGFALGQADAAPGGPGNRLTNAFVNNWFNQFYVNSHQWARDAFRTGYLEGFNFGLHQGCEIVCEVECDPKDRLPESSKNTAAYEILGEAFGRHYRGTNHGFTDVVAQVANREMNNRYIYTHNADLQAFARGMIRTYGTTRQLPRSNQTVAFYEELGEQHGWLDGLVDTNNAERVARVIMEARYVQVQPIHLQAVIRGYQRGFNRASVSMDHRDPITNRPAQHYIDQGWALGRQAGQNGITNNNQLAIMINEWFNEFYQQTTDAAFQNFVNGFFEGHAVGLSNRTTVSNTRTLS